MPTLVHLVYIHGFQGNDTTFQSFPKHLQEHISSRIPAHLDVTFQSSLYPTYKSVKPLSDATRNFLEWLATQPAGPVILLGHSMGGLLAAEAATDSSNNQGGSPPKRIIGVIAFDTPYLGMHPHVVVSGIASLLPKGDKDSQQSQPRSDEAMNDHPQVEAVDERVTDDWEAFKNQNARTPKAPSIRSGGSYFGQSPQASDHHLEPLSPGSPSIYSSYSTTSQSSSPFVDKALTFVAKVSEDPIVRWIRKHADDPFSSGKRWIVERFQFGGAMFEPQGLTARYTKLVGWQGGKWINYWTETVPRHGSHIPPPVDQADNNAALVANGIVPPGSDTSSIISTGQSSVGSGPTTISSTLEKGSSKDPNDEGSHVLVTSTVPTKEDAENAEKEGSISKEDEEAARKAKEKSEQAEEKKRRKDAEKAEKARLKAIQKAQKSKPSRHFIVLPNGMGEYLGGWDRWERVPIRTDDEVSAHMGLFIAGQNLNYLGFVENVANRILGWCEELPDVHK